MNSHWKKGIVTAALSLVIFVQSTAAHADSMYKAKDRDTFWKISSQFGVSVDLLQQANPFVDAGNIYEGLMLVIPTTVKAKTEAPMKVEKLSAAKQQKPAAKAVVKAAKTVTAAKKVAPKAAVKKIVMAPVKKVVLKKAVKKASTASRRAVVNKPQADHVSVNGKSYVYTDVVQAKASAYTAAASENGWGAVDYYGNPLKLGTIAVDPDVIPMGSKVYITGYDHNGLPSGGMMAVASDQGSAINGNRIDIFVPESQKEASQFGFQNVKVFVLN